MEWEGRWSRRGMRVGVQGGMGGGGVVCCSVPAHSEDAWTCMSIQFEAVLVE